ncbi:uncharacterized protein LOC116852685 [Odontomachus brunneus]|uniref:uncharacterized protein LOC116852685 n=1 Tax=Odontomachus brunneus TaxID=486640 RepID=UPI0013F23E97|nr:uncharacterized protein LOC116852685 [Odontomachus brunneus]
MPVIITTEDLTKAQQIDDTLKEIIDSDSSSLKLRKLQLDNGEASLFCDVSGNNVCVRKSQNVKMCLPCQRNKIQQHVKTIPEQIAIPDERFRQIHIDIIGSLSPVNNKKYCLTMVKCFTRWPEAVLIADISAETVSNAFYETWIARFGAPAMITTDRGTQFESRLFQVLSNMIGAKRIHTAYHPASNGMMERWYRTLKTVLTCHGSSNWIEVLPTVLLGLRTCERE